MQVFSSLAEVQQAPSKPGLLDEFIPKTKTGERDYEALGEKLANIAFPEEDSLRKLGLVQEVIANASSTPYGQLILGAMKNKKFNDVLAMAMSKFLK